MYEFCAHPVLMLIQAELERQSAYFDTLEKTERMELKMDSVKEKKCKVFSCAQVGYIACL